VSVEASPIDEIASISKTSKSYLRLDKAAPLWYYIGTVNEGTTMLQRINNALGRMMVAGDETSWDYGFMESIKDQVSNGRTLSSNQERHLQQIEGRWSDEALAARAEFANTWDYENEQKFAIALRYYQKTGYYSNIVYKYLDDQGERTGTPTEKEYNKLVLNKYASAVITNALSESKFPVGTTAIFRANAGHRRKNMPVVILQNSSDGSQVRSHAKGAKPIQILMVGSAEPIWTEERYLKRAKKRK
jgi:hypothetical protein